MRDSWLDLPWSLSGPHSWAVVGCRRAKRPAPCQFAIHRVLHQILLEAHEVLLAKVILCLLDHLELINEIHNVLELGGGMPSENVKGTYGIARRSVPCPSWRACIKFDLAFGLHCENLSRISHLRRLPCRSLRVLWPVRLLPGFGIGINSSLAIPLRLKSGPMLTSELFPSLFTLAAFPKIPFWVEGA